MSKDFAYRRCGAGGTWVGRHANESSPNGWTNYTPCFPPLVQSIFSQVYDDEDEAQAKFGIAEATRSMEIVGFCSSFLAVIASLMIFQRFRSLHNRRTAIHRNLFTANLFENTTRLLLYFDQYLARSLQGYIGINSIPYVCESAYVFLEYTISVMFHWMLIEGMFLNNLVNDRALRSNTSYNTYLLIGWLLPLIGTTAWALTTGYFYLDEKVNVCWYGYNFHWFYWLAQGPRSCIFVLNFYFLLNIMRVLVIKLQQTVNSEMHKIKTAVRAALVLLPLLGMTNIFSMIEAPLDSSLPIFATWCYVTHFFRSFQGLFISVIYCFTNGEVQDAIRKYYVNYRIMRENRKRVRGNVNSVPAIARIDEIEMREELQKQDLERAQGPSTTNNAVDANYSCTVECLGFSLCCHKSPVRRSTAPVVQFAQQPSNQSLAVIDYDPARNS